MAVGCHTGKHADVEALIGKTVERFGQIDVLVNNAATNPHFGPLLTAEEPAWDKTFEVNLKGYFDVARQVANHMIGRSAKGAIVNVASIAGLQAAMLQGIYGMTKAAVISMTRYNGGRTRAERDSCERDRAGVGGNEVRAGAADQRGHRGARGGSNAAGEVCAARGDRSGGAVPRVGCGVVCDGAHVGGRRRVDRCVTAGLSRAGR